MDMYSDGTSQVLTIEPGEGYSFTNNTGIAPGTYNVTAVLDASWVWRDNTYSDKTFNCTIAAGTYIVTFKNGNDIIATEEVAYGESATAPSNPTKEGNAQYTYVFSGWDNDFAYVTSDLIVNALYDEILNSYTIRFEDEDGTELQEINVDYGEVPVYTGEIPTKEGNAQFTYVFNGWDSELVAVTGDATYIATYTNIINEYTISFINYDGTELQVSNVGYGEVPIYTGETPTRGSTAQYTYTFNGWDSELVAVTGNATYMATYTSNLRNYTVTFKNGEEVIKTEEVLYGNAASAPTNPTKANTAQYTYTFRGWDKDFTHITSNLIVNAVYEATLNTYTIRYLDEVGNVLHTYNATYGSSTPVYTITYTKQGYAFDGWNPSVRETVTGNATYITKWKKVDEKYTVRYDISSCENKEVTYNSNYGTLCSPIVVSNYVFKGWYSDSSYKNKVEENTKVTIRENHVLYSRYDSLIERVNKTDNYEIKGNEFNGINTMSELGSNLGFGNDVTVKIYDSGKIKENGYIGTGNNIKVYQNNKEIGSYMAIVKGDVIGNGKVTVADVAKAYQYVKGKISMDDVYVKAGNVVNSDTLVKINDVAKLYQFVKGKIDKL